MTIDETGLVSASKAELFAFWVIDDDLFRLFSFSEWLIRCKVQGVYVT